MLSTALRARLSQIEERIDDLKTQIHSLHAGHVTVNAQLDDIVYPVLTIPNEITTEIFRHYVDNDENRSPLPLTYYDISKFPQWLARAGDLPVELQLGCRLSEAQAVTELLRRYSSQVRALDLSFIFASAEDEDDDSIELSSSFPRLQSFGVHEGGSVIPPPSPLDAPLLRQVTFDEHSAKQWKASLPWTQITKLALIGENVPGCMDILSWTPNLEDLRFQVSQYFIYSRSPLTLPHLRRISLQSEDSNDLLNHLIVPALERLAIVGALSLTASCNVTGLVQRSGCAIHTLELDLGKAGSLWLTNFFLDGTPWQSLRELILLNPSGPYELESLFHSMTSRIHRLLPSLECLIIKRCQFHVRLEPLVDMLAERMEEGTDTSKMTRVQLEFGCKPGDSGEEVEYRRDADIYYKGDEESIDSELDTLDNLCTRGLQVDIRSTVKWWTGSVIEALRGNCLL
ncbi:hypothetical protein FB45DRAFT_1036709 [Roridomyces roridus]|uniref:F-box domain-containing protein n=1 Tax=Roridomyces roridus TaxID=1738132 RepID=A0AAD7B8F8_9AGAR|nr:hypothetical protein FB45DRAFT_1036709 [Roridomyces roridus]